MGEEVDSIHEIMPRLHIVAQRGFQITEFLLDPQFDALAPLICDKIGAPRINVTAANEHVTPVERRIKVVKERCRATHHSLPFPRVTSYMTISMVLFNGRMLNNFPSKGGVSDRFSPRMLLTGENLDAKIDLPLEFCSYCQVHENDEPRNTMVARTQAALSMGPSGNKQGGQNFMSLRTGLKLVRFSWDELPMPDTVVGRVRQLAKGQPELISFLDRKRRVIGHEVELPGVDGVDPQDPQDVVEAVESDELDSINEIVAEARASVPGSADSDGIGVEIPPPEHVSNFSLGEALHVFFNSVYHANCPWVRPIV